LITVFSKIFFVIISSPIVYAYLKSYQVIFFIIIEIYDEKGGNINSEHDSGTAAIMALLY